MCKFWVKKRPEIIFYLIRMTQQLDNNNTTIKKTKCPLYLFPKIIKENLTLDETCNEP